MTDPTRFFLNTNNGFAGFNTVANSDLLISGPDLALTAWDLQSDLAPIVVEYEYLQWIDAPVGTTRGVLIFSDTIVRGTFAARVSTSAVPLPAAGWLLVAGLAGLAAQRRRPAA